MQKEEIFLVSKIEKGVIYAFGFDSKNKSFEECAYLLEGSEKCGIIEKVPRLRFTEKILKVLREKKYTNLNCKDINQDGDSCSKLFAKVDDMYIVYYSALLTDSYSVRAFSQKYGDGGFCLFYNGIFAESI